MKGELLTQALVDTLSQIQDVLTILHALPNSARSSIYIENDIGVHVRHVMDHLQAFLTGLGSSEVDYNTRNRSAACETDLDIANMQLETIVEQVKKLNKEPRLMKMDLMIVSEIDCFSTHSETVHSNFAREVLYLINHTIHHAAYIRLLLRNRDIALPDHIGIAPCTATFQRMTHRAQEIAH